ncbi:MAG: hypothetical protein IPP69_03955 [Flavobacteriales bacterium]|nr:hypothetical protein [Flavobacteriales bacterium]
MNINRILMYTMIALIAIATYMTINSYYTQLAIYEEKEIFKLDCIARAVAYKISGEEYTELIDKYPSKTLKDEAFRDTSYQKIYQQLTGAVKMTMLPSEMYTLTKDDSSNKYITTIATDSYQWLQELPTSAGLDPVYNSGGMIGRFKTGDGTQYIGAVGPIQNSNMQTVGALQVNETFDSFLMRAREQIYRNIVISLIFISIVAILMFISVKSILTRQNKLALEKIELENMRRELLANVSHDIRTPLFSIHGYVETMLMKKDSLDKDQMTKYLETTLQGTQRLKTMVDELFELSKLESKERKLNLEIFDLAEVVQDTTSGFQVEANQKGIQLKTEMNDRGIKVNGDIALIDRVVNNLLSNAIKHCKNGDQILVHVSKSGQHALVSVKDSGSGISPEDLPHIFNRFHKGKAEPGTGLGLAIVKSIMDLHGTSCTVESKTGEGSSFSFRLPLA